MPDYIYLLENRLSADQQNALRQLREAAREAGTILFLTGDAVRDLTSGHAVRGLEISVHGNALNLKKTIEKFGAAVWGQDEVSRTLYLCFPGTVRVDVVSTHRADYPKPGKPIFHPASIQEDLRRRDFTANAMAISLNEGSFGLLMDPTNGVADIESRTLRLVSNYGFLDDPSLLIRATRYCARLGWELDHKTRTRYENAKGDGVIEHLSMEARRQELEQIGHEEDALKVLRALEAEGWMKVLFPAWTPAKADEEKLKALHDLAAGLLAQGVHADMSAAQMELLTVGLAPKDRSALKKMMLRPGFVAEWNSLDAMAAGFAKALLAEENSAPSAGYKLFTSFDPEAVLWLGFTSKAPEIQERFDLFLKVWPEARQRIPHALMHEMRITPELTAYREVVQAVFLGLIDGRLTAPEEIRAFLEPHSPPAPPPKETVKRPRAKRGAEARLKEHSYEDEEDAEGVLEEDEDLDDLVGDEDDLDLGLSLPKVDLETEIPDLIETDLIEADAAEDEDEADESEPVAAPVKRGSKTPAPPKSAKETSAPAPLKAEETAPALPVARQGPPKVEVAMKLKPAPKLKPEPNPAPAPAKPATAPVVKKAGHASAAGNASKAAKPKVGESFAASTAPVKKPKAPEVRTAPAKGSPARAAASKAGKSQQPAKASKPGKRETASARAVKH